ncbi:MAG: FtsX-like permease family protein [Flaviflexus sp.]|uniref:FtsX-like permease family protein n=1 Tax=Flaviflexus sp. TaxID=1969482 RepID=UPI003F8F247A
MRGKIPRLGGKFLWAYKSRILVLALLVAISLIVQLIVAELSRASTEGLDDALEAEVGTSGIVWVQTSDTLGLDSREFYEELAPAMEPFAQREVTIIENYGGMSLLCEADGGEYSSVTVGVAMASDGGSADLPFGTGFPANLELCLGGQKISHDAAYATTKAHEILYQTNVLMVEQMAPLMRSLFGPPTSVTYLLVIDEGATSASSISGAVQNIIDERAKTYGYSGGRDVVAASANTVGEDLRDVAAGTELVYGIIGWGVLVLGALGVLVAESISVRQRTWFYGLARALGARRYQIGFLVLLEVLVIFALGLILAIAFALAAQDLVASFAEQTFDVSDTRLLRADDASLMVSSAVVVLLIAAVFPTIQAMRQDLLDVLEPKVG